MANDTICHKEGVDPYEGCLPDGLLFKTGNAKMSMELGKNIF